MRKFVHLLTGLILLAVLIGLSVALMHMAARPEMWVDGLAGWREERGWGFLVGLGLLAVVFVYGVSGLRPCTGGERYLSFSHNGVTVSILLRAVNEFIAKIGDEFAAIISLKPCVYSRGRSIDITLEVRVKAGTQIPELCQLLQERVRESLQQNLGLGNIKQIKVQVRDIVGDALPEEDLLDAGT